MAIAFVDVGPKTGSDTANLPVTYPSGIQAGDLLVLLRACWLSGMQLATPAGWTSRADGAGGTNTAVDAHNSRINVCTKVADGTESGTLATISDGGTVSGQIGMIAVYRNATGAWDIAGVGGSTAGDGSHGTNRGTGTSGTLALAPDDLILAGIATDTDAVLSATGALITFSGTTPNAATLRTNGANGTDAGLDGNVDLADRLVASGTATVGGAFAWTTSVSQCGPVGFVRLREAPAAGSGAAGTASLEITAAGAGTADGTGTAALALDAAGTAQAQTAGSAALALAASGAARAATTGTASLSLSAAGTGRAALSGTASLALTATGAARATLTGSASLVLAASGDTSGAQAATGTATLSLSAVGSAAARATGSASLSLTASGVVAARLTGTVALLLTASGQVAARLTAAALLDLLATGQVAVRASGAAQLLLDAIGQASTPGDVYIDAVFVLNPPPAFAVAEPPAFAVARPPAFAVD